MENKSYRKHQPLRVPDGWNGQDRSLVIQIERLLDEIFNQIGSNRDAAVTNIAYDSSTKKLTMTVNYGKNAETSDIVAIAALDGNGKIPAALLPSYVDDVEEYDDLAHFPATGESDKIYVAVDTGFTYRWSGSQYVRLNTYDEATQSASGLMSASDKTKLDGIEDGANNYSLPLAASGTRGGIKVGYTESGKKYAVQLSDEKAYVEVPWNDTKNSAGTTNWINKKLFLVGAETQATNPTTNSNVNVYIGTDNCLYSNGTKVLTSHQDLSGYEKKCYLTASTLADTESGLITIWEGMSDNESRIGYSYISFSDSATGFDGSPGTMLCIRRSSGIYAACFISSGLHIACDYYYGSEHHWKKYPPGSVTWGDLAGQ